MIKKIGFLLCLFFCATSSYAADSYPVDTVALDEALKEISRVGDSTDPEKIEDAQADLYMYFINNSSKQLPPENIINQCVKIVRHNRSCMKFLQTYSHYLNHANFCLKANNFTNAVWFEKKYSFKDCYREYDTSWHNYDGTVNEELSSTRHYDADSIVGQCRTWIDSAEKCQNYLIGYYSERLANSKLSKSDKKYYECLLDKTRTGNMDFPLSKMEETCKQ